MRTRPRTRSSSRRVPGLGGTSVEDYANRLFRHWALGQKAKNNGVLLVVAPNERKARIEVGYGLEGALTDALTKVIIATSMAPKFKQNDFPGGLQAGVDAILSVLTGDAEEWQRRAKVRSDESAAIDPVPRSRDPDRPRFRAGALDAGPRRTSALPPHAQRRLDRGAGAERRRLGRRMVRRRRRRFRAAGSRAVAALPAAAAPRGIGDAERRRQRTRRRGDPRRRGEHGRGDRRRGGAPGERLSIGGAALCADRRRSSRPGR